MLDNHPDMEKEIMPIITKEISDNEALEGKKILKQYGLSKDLEDKLSPYINKTIIKTCYLLIPVFAMMSFVFFICNYIQYGLIYGRIRRITFAAKEDVEGEYNISLYEAN